MCALVRARERVSMWGKKGKPEKAVRSLELELQAAVRCEQPARVLGS